MAVRSVSLAASAVLVAALLGVPAATAAEPADLDPAEPYSAESCAVGLEPIDARSGAEAFADLPEPTIDCFPTFAEAIEFATDGAITAGSAEELDQPMAELGITAMVASSVLLGIEYKEVNYSGQSLLIYASSGSGCTSTRSYGYPTMPAGWNNVVSSARSYNGCRASHYDYTYYRGDRRLCWGSCMYMGDMNNRTSSIRFHQ